MAGVLHLFSGPALRLGQRDRKRRDRCVRVPVPHDLVFRLFDQDLHRHGGHVYPDADLFLPCAGHLRNNTAAESGPAGLHARLLRVALRRRDVGHAERREKHVVGKRMARDPELRRHADDLPDLLPLHLLYPPKGQGRRAPARRLSGLFPYHGRVRGAERL